MKKTTTIVLLLFTQLTLFAQHEWVLQPWVTSIGTYPGQRLGSSITVPSASPDFNFKVLISDAQQTGCYTFNDISDTNVRRIILGNNILTGDLNNDNYIDIVINKTTNDYDTVFIYWGTTAGTDTLNPLIIPGEYQYDRFKAVTIGDINNDGKKDLVLTAPSFPDLLSYGKLYIYLNPVNKTIPDYSIVGDTVSAGLGINTIIGDLNNDGLNDLAVKGVASNRSSPGSCSIRIYKHIFK